MRILSSELINLPVYAQNGQNLGRIDSFEVDVDAHTILRYHIKTGLIKGLWHEQLVVAQSQVISISKTKMVVKDGVIKKPALSLKKARMASPATK